MLNFKPKEFMQVMIEMRDELKAVRKLLEEWGQPNYSLTINSDGYFKEGESNLEFPLDVGDTSVSGGIYEP